MRKRSRTNHRRGTATSRTLGSSGAGKRPNAAPRGGRTARSGGPQAARTGTRARSRQLAPAARFLRRIARASVAGPAVVFLTVMALLAVTVFTGLGRTTAAADPQ